MLRQVRQFLPDSVNALHVYDAMKVCPAMLGKSAQSIEILLRDWWKFYLVDDVGLLCFDPFQPGKAHVHVTFWDRRLRGREELCRQMCLMLMEWSNVQLVLTAIPLDARVVRAFAIRVGFKPWKVLGDKEIFAADAACFTMKQPGVN